PTPPGEVLLLTSLANASFCRLFGGDLTAVAMVFIATLAGFKLKQIMMADKRDIRVVFLCCAFFSAAICAGAHIFDLGKTPEIALGTSVLYLIPGVPYINSVSDLLASHYLCAFSRFVDALVLTACLSVGLCAGMYLLGLRMF
ncbi:MAG: threonine/serine exporter family protein, partial [Muribaculaceae bacterium]|nr:threonine/serine exporter family protein [Muribaculaceae bacterium]